MLENRPRNQPYGMVCHSCQNAPRNTKECKPIRSSPSPLPPIVASLQPPFIFLINPATLIFPFKPLSLYVSLCRR